MGGCLFKAHWHPEPPKLTPVGNKGQVIERGSLKWDVVEAGFQVQHTIPFGLPKLHLVSPHIVELLLVLGHLFFDWDNILAHLVGLPRLDTRA